MEEEKILLADILKNKLGRCNERYFRIHLPLTYDKLLQIKGESFSERLFNYLKGSPIHICPVCGKETGFQNLRKGYSRFCSVACSYKSKERTERIKDTVRNKYGTDNVSQVEEVKRKKEERMKERWGGIGCGSKEIKEKSKKTVKEKYGVDNISQIEDVKRKKEDTTIKNHGVKNILILKKNQEKAKQKIKEIYKVDSIFQSDVFKNKSKQTKQQSLINTYDELISIEENGEWRVKCPHPECNKCIEKCFLIKPNTYYDRIRMGYEPCTKLVPYKDKNQGTTIELFVRSILDSLNISYKTNVRDVIPPLELDLWIPSKNIAIECNGIYFHSLKQPSYHVNKFHLCQEKGIQLLTFWEDQILRKPGVVESILRAKLGRIENKVYARKCDIVELNSKESNLFLEENHIQGKLKGGRRWGLKTKSGETVCMMVWVRKRGCMGDNKKEDGEWELARYCNKRDTVVVGGCGKLIKHFIKTTNPKTIYSFSSNDISLGNLYKTLGFNILNESKSYFYVDPKSMNRYHRTAFTKGEIIRRGWRKDKEGWTEGEVVKERGMIRCWDSGKKKWVMNL